MSGADLPPEMYERLALDMLAVQSGDLVEVKDAMRTAIESAPKGRTSPSCSAEHLPTQEIERANLTRRGT